MTEAGGRQPRVLSLAMWDLVQHKAGERARFAEQRRGWGFTSQFRWTVGEARLGMLAACIALWGLTGCSRPQQIQTPPPIVTLDDLTSALRNAGARVQPSSAVGGPILEVRARWLAVDAAEILVYEYASEAERRAVSTSIAEDPTVLGGEVVDWPSTPRIWASGRLIIAYMGVDGGTILLLSSLLGDPLRSIDRGVDEPYPPAVAAAIGALASKLGVEPATIEVTGYQAVDWPDACLGWPEADEACADVVTPGWRVTLSAEGMAHEAHTDFLGRQVRLR